jgi:hypothetical protein
MIQMEEGRLIGGVGGLWQRWLNERAKLIHALAAILKQGAEAGSIRTDIPGEVLATYLLGMLRTRSRFLANIPGGFEGMDVLISLFLSGAGGAGGEGSGRRVE